MKVSRLDWDIGSLKRLAALNRKQTRRIIEPEYAAFLEALRGFCPKEGQDYQKAICVVVKRADSVPEHFHPEHTVLFYVEPLNVPIIVEGQPFQPSPGDVVYLPPNVRHSVPRNLGNETRISIAMLVDP